MKQAPCHRRAYTAVELLVALASMLLVAAFSAVRSMAASRKALIDSAAAATWRDRIVDRLRRDLDNSRQFEFYQGRLRLVGYAGEDFTSGQATLRPAEIVYRIARLADENWLVRDEVHLDSLSNRNSRTECVCRGATAVVLETGGRSPAGKQRLRPLPDRLQIVLHGKDPDAPIAQITWCR